MTRAAMLLVTLVLALVGVPALQGDSGPAARADVPGTSNGGVRILPLGDSITHGWQFPGGYRTRLWQNLAADGARIDFVGTQANGTLPDPDHEGHGGWRIDQIDAQVVSWLNATDPRTVLLHIGTNDMIDPAVAPGAVNRLSALIDKIRITKPDAEIFVATIVRTSIADRIARTEAYNADVRRMVPTKGPKVHLVDMYPVLDDGDLLDRVHPNQAGYDAMADAWTAALRSVPDSLKPVPSGSGAPIGAKVFLRDDRGGYLSARVDRDPTAPLYANGGGPWAWEEFVVEDAGGGKVALRNVNTNAYVRVSPYDPQHRLQASAPRIGAWEKFTWVDQGGGKVALLTASTGLYVSSRHDRDSSPLAGMARKGPWEVFSWSR